MSKKDLSFEDAWRVEIRRGLLQYAVLAIVKRHNEGIHGYGIVRELEERTDGVLEVKEGTLYPILHRLKKERLLNDRVEKSDILRVKRRLHLICLQQLLPRTAPA